MRKSICLLLGVLNLEVAYSQQNSNGKVGVNTNIPTENLDISGRLRVRTLPNQNTTNAISTDTNGNGQETDNQTFSANSIVVADKNGVLGKIPSQTARRTTTNEEYNNSTSMFVIRRFEPGDANLHFDTGMSIDKWEAIMGGAFFEYITTPPNPNPKVFPQSAAFGWKMTSDKKTKTWKISGEINDIIESPIIDVLFINKNFVMAQPR